jgi:hypothetical protein
MANVSSFRDEIRQDLPGCPDVAIDRGVLRACSRFCDKTLMWQYELTAIDIVDGTYEYTLTPPANSLIVSLVWVKDDSSKVKPKSESWLDQMLGKGWRTAESSTATYCYMNANKDTLRLYAIPTEDKTGGLEVKVSLKPDHTATTVEDFLYNDYYDAISYGARAYLFSMKEMPWVDLENQAYYDDMFKNEIGKAKANLITGFSGTGYVA